MAKTIELRVLTREGLALEDRATSIVAPGELGYLGLLFNHAPLVTTLTPGKLSWQPTSGPRRAVLIGDGLMEIAKNRCTLLTNRVSEEAAPAREGRHVI